MRPDPGWQVHAQTVDSLLGEEPRPGGVEAGLHYPLRRPVYRGEMESKRT